MRITVQSSGEKAIKVYVPTILICNPIVAIILCKKFKKTVPEEFQKVVTIRNLCRLARELNRAKRKFPNMNLVEVEDSDGDLVYIKL